MASIFAASHPQAGPDQARRIEHSDGARLIEETSLAEDVVKGGGPLQGPRCNFRDNAAKRVPIVCEAITLDTRPACRRLLPPEHGGCGSSRELLVRKSIRILQA